MKKNNKKIRKEQKMKNKNTPYSPYATNKGGKISSPKGKPQGEPTCVRTTGDDLRVKKGR